MRLYTFLILLLLAGLNAGAQTYTLTGKVTDPQQQPIGFASIYIKNTTYGTTANSEGLYKFNLKPGSYEVIYRFVGYKQQSVKVTVNQQPEVRDVQLVADSFQLKRTMVRSRRDPDATAIMRKVIAKRRYFRDEVDAYTCAVYIKGVQRLLSAPKKLMSPTVVAALELDSTGKGILYQSEILSEFSYSGPDKIHETTIASKSAGQNAAFSYNKASDLQVNFYKNWFRVSGLSVRGFISPVASFAMFYYRYRLLGSATIDGYTVHKIEVIPKRTHDPVFRGVIYVIDGDWRLYGTDVFLTKDANINLLDTLEISQQYIPVKDKVWMPASIQYVFKGDVLGFKFDGYYAGIYNNYNLSPSQKYADYKGEIMRVDTQANSRDAGWWDKNRPLALTKDEAIDYQRKDPLIAQKQSLQYLDSVEHVNNQMGSLTLAVTGYQYKKRSTGQAFYVYPLIQTFFYNTVEGYGLNPKIKYTKTYEDGRNYSITPALRYGFSNKLFNANLAYSYVYNPAQQAQFYGSFGSDVLDLSDVGTRTTIFNTLSTLLYENNYTKYYRSQFGQFGYQRELVNGVLWNAELSYANRTQLYNTSGNHIFDNKNKEYTSNNPLDPATETQLFPRHRALTFKTSFLFTFGQHYVTRPTGRVYETPIYPRVRLNYRRAFGGVLGTDANYDFGSVEVFDDYVSTGLLGFSAYKLSAGTFFNKSKLYFMDYNHFLGNQGMVYDPTIGNFLFLPFYANSANNTFVEAHYEHNFAGNIFNMVPFLRKLKIEEVVGGNYLTERGNNNYYEFYFGVKRLFLRFSYGFAYSGNRQLTQGVKIFYGLR